jgi:hypothetical protein
MGTKSYVYNHFKYTNKLPSKSMKARKNVNLPVACYPLLKVALGLAQFKLPAEGRPTTEGELVEYLVKARVGRWGGCIGARSVW